jgi:hypothetical protein
VTSTCATTQRKRTRATASGRHFTNWSAEADEPARLANGAELTLDSDSMTLTLALTQGGELLMTPKVDAQNRVRWFCSVGEGLSPKALPRHCQTGGAR